VTGALVYLGFTTRKNALVRWAKGLRQPRKALSAVVLLLVLALFATHSSLRGDGQRPEAVHDRVVVLLSFFLLTSVVNGLLLRGVAFDAAEADVLLPAPFRRGTLLVYKIVGGYPPLVLTATFGLFFVGGFTVPRPWLGWVGALLYFVMLSHLGTLAGLLASRVRHDVWSKWVFPLRVVGVVALLGGIGLLLPLFFEEGGLSAVAREAVSSRVARLLFTPAFAAANLGVATGGGEVLAPLTILVAGCGVTLALALWAGAGLVEWPVAERPRRRLARAGLAGAGTAPSSRLPSWRILRGAGALFWKNLILARRAWLRTTLGILVVGGFIVLPVTATRPGSDAGEMVPLFAALVPLFLGETLGFDFRREMRHFAELKAFPASPTAVAAAQIASSTVLGLAAQALTIGLAAGFGFAPRLPVALLAVAFPPVTFFLFALQNWSVLRHPRSRGAALFVFFPAFAVLMLPPAVAFLVLERLQGDVVLAAVPALAILVAEDALLLWMTGRAFAKIDVSRDLASAPAPVG
jgi:hypothetical protein